MTATVDSKFFMCFSFVYMCSMLLACIIYSTDQPKGQPVLYVCANL
jgi:hypothetical protein